MLMLAKRLSDMTTDDVLNIALIVMFIGLVSIVIMMIMKRKVDSENAAQPIRSVEATVIDMQKLEANAIAFEVWVMFEDTDGKRMRLMCKANHDFIVGDKGYATWQGSKLISFARGKKAPVHQTDPAQGAAPMPQGKIPAWKQVELENKEKQNMN